MRKPQPHAVESTAAAIEVFLSSLNDSERSAAQFSFDDETARRDWHYIPRDRPGVCLADLAALQQKRALQVLATGFSTEGFAAACAVMALEDTLDVVEGGAGPRRFTGSRGWGRHRSEYHVAVFGSPGDERWGWRFEGHHLSVTCTISDGDAMVTVPHFLGSNPAEIGGIRLLPREEDLALSLLELLPPDQRRRAIVDTVAPDDILTTNSPSLDVLPPVAGVRLGDLDAAAQRAAAALVDVYVSREPQPRPVDLPELRFCFLGEPEHRRPQYYRLQGDDLLVEYDNTQNDANHLHTVVRWPGNDFGDDLLRGHRGRHHRPDGE